MAKLSLQNLAKNFKGAIAVRGVTLDIESGEFFSILGPSGCGKTTLLRMIAGFDAPSSGSVLLDGDDITQQLPQFRGIGMVFQNYALFPHMTVFQNVAFGLETKKLPQTEIRSRVEGMLQMVHLHEKRDVLVPNLSGGEQQRVAVARALVVEPKVLLFDEPLSNLDVALRVQTREEIRSLQRTTRITTVYVTHDQSEAMSLSDRIAVMRAGSIDQVGTPAEIYESPASPFVAQFVGGANLLKGIISASGSDHRFIVAGVEMPIPAAIPINVFGKVTAAVKPEAIRLEPESTRASWTAIVASKEYQGYTTNVVLMRDGLTLRVAMLSSAVSTQIDPGAKVAPHIDWSRCTIFPGW